MNLIIALISPGDSGPLVANLQDALLALLEREIIRPLSAPNRPTLEELEKLSAAVKGEREQSLFSRYTQELIRYFQVQEGLSDNLYGVVEDTTAAKLNDWLKKLRLFDISEPDVFVVRGTVKTSDAKPISAAIVSAFDLDMRKQQPLGDKGKTDAQGQYTIRYGLKDFASGDVPSATAPRLIVRAFAGDQQIGKDVIRRPASRDEIVNFEVPAPVLSEWEGVSAGVIPLLKGQGDGDQALPAWQINDSDLNFIAEETGLDREKIRLWALAFAVGREAAVVMRRGGVISTGGIGTHALPDSATDDGLLTFAIFYGWFRLGLPTDWDTLKLQQINALRKALLNAIDQNIIPDSIRQNIESILALVPNPQVKELETLLVTALSLDKMRVVLTLADGIEAVSDEVLAQLVEQKTLVASEAQLVGLKVSLHRLTGGDDSIVSAMLDSEFSSVTTGKLKHARDLAVLEPQDWEPALETAGAPLPAGLSRAAYARELAMDAANAYPDAAFRGRAIRVPPKLDEKLDVAKALLEINRKALTLDFEALDLANVGAGERDALREAHTVLKNLANVHPGLGLHEVFATQGGGAEAAKVAGERIGWLRTVLNLNPDMAFLDLDYLTDSRDLRTVDFGPIAGEARERVVADLKAHQRIQSVTDNAISSQEIMKAGFHSASAIALTPVGEFAARTGMPERESHAYHAQARERANSAAIDWFRVYDLARDRTTAPSRFLPAGEFFRPLKGFAELINDQPWCECAQCQSVLSPAAYFVDLMHYIEQNILKDSFAGKAGHLLHLQTRRLDLWDLELTCKNTNEYIPYLDVVNEVLETFLKKSVPVASTAALYKLLSEQERSFKQPFNLPLGRVEMLLGHFGSTRYEIANAIGATADVKVRARLNISRMEYDLITTEGPAGAPFLWQLFQLGGVPSVNTPDAVIAPFEIATLLRATGLEHDVIEAVLKSKFVLDGSNIATIQVVLGKRDPDDVQNNSEVVQNLTLRRLDRIHRFVRLWRKLAWTVDELDVVLQQMVAPGQITRIDPAAGGNMGTLESILDMLDLSAKWSLQVDELVALSGTFPAKGLREATSLFDRLLNEPSVVIRDGKWPPAAGSRFTHPAWEKRHAPGVPVPPRGVSAPANNTHLRLLAGLQLEDEEFLQLVARLKDVGALDWKAATTLTDESISLSEASFGTLYRHARVKRLLGRTSTDFIKILELAPRRAALPNDAARYIANLEDVTSVIRFAVSQKISGFSLDEIRYVTGGARPEGAMDPAKLAAEIVASVEAERSLEFADTIFTQLGFTESRSRATVKSNLSVNASDTKAFEWLPEGRGYRLKAGSPSPAMTGSSDEVGFAIALLGKYDPLHVLDVALAGALVISAQELQEIRQLADPLTPADIKSISLAVQGGGNSQDAARLTRLIAETLRYRALFKSKAFDLAGLRFVKNNLAAFEVPLAAANRIISSAVVRNVAAYAALATSTDDGFTTASGPVDVAALQRVIPGIGAASAHDLAKALRRDEARISVLMPHLQALPSNPFDALHAIAQCVELSSRLGVSGETLKLMIHEEATAAGTFEALSRAAEDVLGAFRAKYSPEKMQAKLEPYEDILRGRKRDGLVDYIVTGWPELFSGPGKLYEYFLIDVMLGGCARTSRVVAAISSVQLYVHRVLMNLERSKDWNDLTSPATGVYARFKDAGKRAEWPWRRFKRGWEANRKVFLYPENYIEPELRDDKTSLFRELEDTLLLEEISKSSVHDAYSRYLIGFDDLAHLKIAGAFYDASKQKLHLFGVSQDDAPVYYYREVDESGSTVAKPVAPRFASWQKLNLQIPVRKVSPIYFNERLYVFWMETATRPVNKFVLGSSEFAGYRHTVRVKFSTLMLDGTWSPPKIISFVENGGTGECRIVEDPLDTTRRNEITSLLTQLAAQKEGLDRELTENVRLEGVTHNAAEAATRLRIGKRGTYNNWVAAIPIGGPIAAAGALVALGELNDAISDENKQIEAARLASAALNATRESLRLNAGVTGVQSALLTGLEILVRWDRSSQNHKEALDSYKPEGWEWDRVYPDVYVQSNGQQAMRLMLVPRNIPVPVRDGVELKPGEFDLNPGVLREMSSGTSTWAVESRANWSNGRLLNDSVGGLSYTGQRFYVATFWLHNPRLTIPISPSSAVGSAPATSDRQIVNGETQSVIIEAQGDAVWMRKTGPASYAGLRLGTKLTPILTREFWRSGASSLLDATFQGGLREIRSDISPVADQGDATRLNPFHPLNPCLTYFRETFFHIPFLVANHLNSQMDFAETQRYYHYIFDPTAATGDAWRYREFRELPKTAVSLRKMLTDPGALEAYRKNPFSPHAIARTRLSAYQKSILMKYIDNLLDWGDNLFNQFTMESINEATMLYVMAQDILGPRPRMLGSCGEGKVSPKTYRTIGPLVKEVNDFLVELESPAKKTAHVVGKPAVVKLVVAKKSTVKKKIAMAATATVGPDGEGEAFAVSEPALQSPLVVRELQNAGATYWTNVGGTPMENVRIIGAGSGGGGGLHVIGLGSGGGLPAIPGNKTGNIDFLNRDGGFGGGKFGVPGGDIIKSLGTLDIKYDLHDKYGPGIVVPDKKIPLHTYDPVELVPPRNAVFCIPPNKDLLAYWGRVEDRLFKIRNCMDIAGVRRNVELFAPEIDPRLLVRMTAAGLSLEDVLNSTSGNLPPYRFTYLIDKAKQYTATVQNFGSQLLSAIEKRDGEELGRLRAVHEQNLLKMRTKLAQLEIGASDDTLESLRNQKSALQYRQEHFRSLLEAGQNASERKQQLLHREAAGYRTQAGIAQVVASLLTIIPDIGAPTSMKFGGSQLGASGRAVAEGLNALAAFNETGAAMAGTEASNQRRDEEWKHQIETAKLETAQIDKNIAAAEIRRDMAVHSLEVHERTIDQTEEIFEFFRDKFSSADRYRLLSKELRRLYRAGFNSALSMAKMAEQAFRVERFGTDVVLSGNYWDAGNAGLLAGERLLIDLQRLEQEYIEGNYRQLEIEQSFSLAQFGPMELDTLRRTGECQFKIPEWFFDLSYPGQYRRRLKAVRMTVPCVVGPLANVAATLGLDSSSIRMTPDTEPISVPLRHTVTIAASKGQYDAGVFDFSFRDERFMPFEGAGAIGTWHVSLPKAVRVFDYGTISDVILHLSYTAEFSESLKARWDGVAHELIALLSDATKPALLTRLFSLRNEFPDAFHRLVNGPVNLTEVGLTIESRHFPLFLTGRSLKASTASLQVISSLPGLQGTTLAVGRKAVAPALQRFKLANASAVPTGGGPGDEFREFDCGEVLESAAGVSPSTPGVSATVIGDYLVKITSAGFLAPSSSGGDVAPIDPRNLQDIVLRVGYRLA